MSADTDCRKCGEPMPSMMPLKQEGWIGRVTISVTAYLYRKCGHWNDLKRRKKKVSK